MDITSLRLFKQLANSLHFGKASRLCNITPSALTRAIQRLENELDQKLFLRDNRSVELSPAGLIFKNYCDQALENWATLQDDLNQELILQGEISLYCSVTAAYTVLPLMLRQFRENYPNLHLNLETGDAAQALTKVANNEVDIAIAALPDKINPGLIFLELITTPLVFIASAETNTIHYHANKIDWQKTPLIIPERGLSRDRIDSWFKSKIITPNIYGQVAGNEALIAMVSLGYGIGVVPLLVLEKSPMQNQITILQNTPKLQPFTIVLCTTKKNINRPRVKAFWDIARQVNHG